MLNLWPANLCLGMERKRLTAAGGMCEVRDGLGVSHCRFGRTLEIVVEKWTRPYTNKQIKQLFGSTPIDFLSREKGEKCHVKKSVNGRLYPRILDWNHTFRRIAGFYTYYMPWRYFVSSDRLQMHLHKIWLRKWYTVIAALFSTQEITWF